MKLSTSANAKRAASALLAFTLVMASASAFAYSLNEPMDGRKVINEDALTASVAFNSSSNLSVNGTQYVFANNLAMSSGRTTGTAISISGRHYEGITTTGDRVLGGAIYSTFGWTDPNGHTPSPSYVRASDTIFINNHAIGSDNKGWGGAIYTGGYVNLTDSSFSGNTATGYGGAIYSDDDNPTSSGGIPLYQNGIPTSVIRNTSITDNHAGIAGGGIYTNGNLQLTADAGKSTVISGNTAAGQSDGIYMNTRYVETEQSKLTVNGAGIVRIDDSIRAEGYKAVDFNKNGSGSLIWGESNYFTNNSSFNFNEGNTTLSDNFSLQADKMSLNFAAGHSLYLDLTNRDRDQVYFDGLAQLSVATGSSLVLSVNDVLNPERALDLGSWLFADVWNLPIGHLYQLDNFEISILVDGHKYIGAFFELIGTDLWLNLAGLSAAATPIPASALLLGTGLAALIRLRRRAA